MTIPVQQSTDAKARAAAARLAQIKAQLNLTPSAMSLQAPRDMAAERAAADFDVQLLSYFWAGGERPFRFLQQAYRIIKGDPEIVVQPPRNVNELTRPEAREFTMGQIFRVSRLLQDPVIRSQGKELEDALMLAVTQYSESYSMRFGVHKALFRNVLLMLASEEQQREWLPLVETYQILGCFAMTELGHSSALRDMETTARYDPTRDEFVIDSPTITATKWWIGMAGQTATHTMLIAQTYINDKHVGLNWFIVQLRDRSTGELLPNVRAGDIGHKVGRQGLDNGWIQFRSVRIPRTQMLARFSRLDRDGTYTPAPSPAVMYATLIPERILLVSNMLTLTSQALTIATRYSVVRRQGHANQQIMDYQTHYCKIVPAIAFSYMIQSAMSTINDQFKILTSGGEMDPIVYLNHMAEMHALSGSLKGLAGWYGSDILETCRRSCGGHAYSAYNNIGQIIDDWGVLTTGGGDNVVLLQQTAKTLIYLLRKKLRENEFPRLLFRSSSHYMLKAEDYLATRRWLPSADISIGSIRECLYAVLVKRLSAISMALDTVQEEDLLLEMVRAAEMHAAAFLFSDAINKFENDTSPIASILQRLTRVWGLHALITYSDQGFREDYVTPTQMKQVEHLYLKSCKELRKQVVGLTDAFAYPDFVLKAPIAKYDGDIYEAYLDTVLLIPDSIGVPQYHKAYIKPLTDP
ncbi:hypothetical protein BX666DRAFT_1992799 [Dichotomocladium elegans]|nr:hypothetical protein BX666DRAFT_1992799 [Dichotomocladium elegans]